MGVGTLRRSQRGGLSDGRQRGRGGVENLLSGCVECESNSCDKDVLHLD